MSHHFFSRCMGEYGKGTGEGRIDSIQSFTLMEDLGGAKCRAGSWDPKDGNSRDVNSPVRETGMEINKLQEH